MKVEKLNALIVTGSDGEKIIFDNNGKEIVNLTKYHEMDDLLSNLVNGTCPEKDDLAKALYSWATCILGYDYCEDWNKYHFMIEKRSIYKTKKH